MPRVDRVRLAWRQPDAPLDVLQLRDVHQIQRPDLMALDAPDATVVGLLLAATRTRDIVDAHVVVCTRRADQLVVTSHGDDLRLLDPGLRLLEA